ncbi:IS3 family transposase [Empedobacter falsenii]|uniref:IS3 family transposase n=1 Tax=Empedobacter falsenii TaxID=343874 RepID=UPI003D7DC079
MTRKVKYGVAFKLRCVKEVLEKHRTIRSISKKENIHASLLKKWVSDYHNQGISGIEPKKNQTYSVEFKLKVIKTITKQFLSFREARLKFNIPSESVIIKWQKDFATFGIDGLKPKPKGRPKTMSTSKGRPKKSKQPLTREEELLLEIERLRCEGCTLKKVQCLNSSRGRKTKETWTQAINELRPEFHLNLLLDCTHMARSSFYYHISRSKTDKYEELKLKIKSIYHQHKGRYGYRRITDELRKSGTIINHKTVLKLMNSLGLKSLIRRKKYKSYKGEQGKIAPNILQRAFKADKPNQKWVTDVTEFKVKDKKLYLSPIMDLYNQEIISYELSERPVFNQVTQMLKKAFKITKDTKDLILHSDQGWQYQMKQYQALLNEKGIIQSMSRKGNCLDNAIIENFFGILKSELFYLQKFNSIEELKKEIKQYIYYYNNDRIKSNLNKMSPIQYRTHFYNY